MVIGLAVTKSNLLQVIFKFSFITSHHTPERHDIQNKPKIRISSENSLQTL